MTTIRERRSTNTNDIFTFAQNVEAVVGMLTLTHIFIFSNQKTCSLKKESLNSLGEEEKKPFTERTAVAAVNAVLQRS